MTAPENGGLTPQQIEVLKLIAQGCTNKQVAEELQITHGTVERHVHDILTTLGLHNRTEAAHWAMQQGVIKLDDDKL